MSDLEAWDDFDNLSMSQFAQLVKNTPNSQLADLMKGDTRGKILDTIFTGWQSTFRADRAGSTNATIRFNITDRPDGGVDSYALAIAEGTCTLSPSLDHDPNLAITVSALNFLKLVSGTGNPMVMYMTGKLKAKGDLGLAANINNLFDLPKT